jgi:hypothetical protein
MPARCSLNSSVAIIILFFIFTLPALAVEPPVVPIGLDAFRQWERWPYQRIGVRAYMRSTYDRRGGNEGADASHFLYQLTDDNNVTLGIWQAETPASIQIQKKSWGPLNTLFKHQIDDLEMMSSCCHAI